MSYWQNALSNRISRRRGMLATGTGALGAAFLAACGGGSDSKGSGETKDASGLVTAAKDETKDVKRGGTLWNRTTSEPVTMPAIAVMPPSMKSAVLIDCLPSAQTQRS